MRCTWLLFGFASLVALVGCGKKEIPTYADHSSSGGHGGHAHVAPHGGALFPLGDHAYNLEVTRDPTTGTIELYVLGGHAENFVRIGASTLAINIAVGTEMRGLLLKAVANPATGETVGDTAHFTVQADWLTGSVGFDAIIPSIEIRGTRFENVAVRLPDRG